MPGHKSKPDPAAEVVEALRRFLVRHSCPQGYRVAFSGGRDSTVLLHALAGLRDDLKPPLRVVHVNHGLSPQADLWADACRRFCERLELPIDVLVVDATARGESPEAAARHARYEACESLLGEGEGLLTAHHREDQAETLLLQLLRGGGVHGLAAMPEVRPLGRGLLMRPLLELERATLAAYAERHGLDWIDDPSNFDTGFERNWLRHELLPQLRHRHSAVDRVLARSAGHFAESAELLDELAKGDYRQARGEMEGTLSVPALGSMKPARARNLLRHWLRCRGLPIPGHQRLEQILSSVLTAREDALPQVAWPGGQVRRYRDALYAMFSLPPPLEDALDWDGRDALLLPNGLGRLRLSAGRGRGLHPDVLAGRLTVRARRGGERCRLAGRKHTRDLKRLLQEAAVPPWLRERLPLLYLDEELAAVPGVGVCQPFAVEGDKEGLWPEWDISAIEIGAENNDN